MQLATVVGQVIATAKAPELGGLPLQIVEPFPAGPNADTYVAVDLVGAGEGEVVLVVTGSGARVATHTDAPVDAAIVAIADTVVLGGRPTYRK